MGICWAAVVGCRLTILATKIKKIRIKLCVKNNLTLDLFSLELAYFAFELINLISLLRSLPFLIKKSLFVLRNQFFSKIFNLFLHGFVTDEAEETGKKFAHGEFLVVG